VRIPKLRQGSYFPEWLLDVRTRSERAFVQVATEACVRGISTRKVEGLVEALGVTSLSKSHVSELARDLDQTVAEFRNRPQDANPHTYVWADAQVVKCRESGGVVNVAKQYLRRRPRRTARRRGSDLPGASLPGPWIKRSCAAMRPC